MTSPTPLPDGYIDVPSGKLAAVVTSLEMRVRPPSRPCPDRSSWALRRVERPTAGWYRGLYRHVGEEWLWFSRLTMADDALLAIISDPAVHVFALLDDGTEQGLLELDFRMAGECEIAFFGVAPTLVGRGAGRWLMNHAIEQAWSHPIRRFWVHTCTLDHPGALAFYIRSGFVPFRRQIEIADDPRLIGQAPRRSAAHVPLL